MYRLRWSPDGKRVAVFHHSVEVWNPQRIQQLLHFGGKSPYRIWDLAWSPDGTCLAFGGSDYDGKLQVWDAYQGNLKHTLRRHYGSIWSVAWSPDGKWLASGGDGNDPTVRIWDPWKKDQPLRTLKGHTYTVKGLAWSPDSTLLASASLDGTVRIWNPQKKIQQPKILRFSSQDFGPSSVERGKPGLVQWSPDGETLASLHDGIIRIWNLDEDYPLVIRDGVSRICSLALSSERMRAASGCDDGKIRLWDLEHARLLQPPLEGHKANDINAVVWSPDGMLLASSGSSTNGDTEVLVWNTRTGEIRARFEGHSEVAWHPSRNTHILATLEPQGRGLSIWNADDHPQVVLRGEESISKSGQAHVLTKQPSVERVVDSSQHNPEIVLQEKIARGDFDVFLCHNGQDKAEVKRIGERLKLCGILPWLDEWELRPGLPWQQKLEEQITQIKMAAVLVGKSGVGPWQQQELDAFLREFVQRRCPIIPVLLPDTPQKPNLPAFLNEMTWVDFRVQDPNPMQQLLWGITGKKEWNPSYDDVSGQATRLDHTNAFASARKGFDLYPAGNYDQARDTLEHALSVYEQMARLTPNDYNEKGNVLYFLDRYEQALDAYEQAIRLDPNFALAQRNKGFALKNLSRYEQALDALEQAIRLDPNDSSTYSSKGDTLKHLGRQREAEQAYEKAQQLGSKP